MLDSTKTLHITNFFSSHETLESEPGVTLIFKSGDNLLDTLNAGNVSISQSCGGGGSCTTCRVLVRKGLEKCSPRTEIEAERALERDFTAEERLACQTSLFDSVEIEILPMDFK